MPGFVAQEVRNPTPGTTDFEVRLVKGAVVAGRLTDHNGEPVVEVKVTLRPTVESPGEKVTTHEVETNDSRRVPVRGAGEGQYTVVAPWPWGSRAVAAPGGGVVRVTGSESRAIVQVRAGEETSVSMATDPNVPPAVQVPFVSFPSVATVVRLGDASGQVIFRTIPGVAGEVKYGCGQRSRDRSDRPAGGACLRAAGACRWRGGRRYDS